jgi:hypothetical protein
VDWTRSSFCSGGNCVEVKWQRSTACGETSCLEVASGCGGGHCVECAGDGTDVLVRDSKHPEVAPFRFTRDEWTAFLDGVQRGDFRF